MKVVGIIPARYGSTRFPGKPLIDLKGKSMIQRVYEGAKQSKSFDHVVVATDDQRIFNAVEAFGGTVMMTSGAHRNGTDRCAEIAAKLDCDVVVNVQGDEPLIDYRQLDTLCQAFNDPTVQIATLGKPGVTEEERDNPNRIKLVKDANNNALYFSRSAIPNTFHAQPDDIANFPFLRHIGVYAYRADVLKELPSLKATQLERIESLEQLRWLYYGYTIRIVETDIETPNIDTPEDVQKVLDLL